ncbi:hypothetical protein [Haploplasma axanthum]|uniref:Bacterial Ig-like domain (Group 3) n=1 Tax=Haploplasma axanthum TaxID=29552 RepID=A0A449BD53_HAPAX|nr:hypothetical protein [Haploplasma axanthum]VEU80358.1 Bacterial Ig-like domain (group 3) [Haploplasma axanthum]
MQIIMTVLNILSMYKVVWKNTVIDIPLNDNIYDYVDYPEASLYDLNDFLVSTDYYYEKGVNRTSLSVVNSKHVKSFRIIYRVTYSELDISFDEEIIFNIIDNKPPEIIKIPEIVMPVKTKLLTEKEIVSGLIYKDNYYKTEELTVKVLNLNHVNINKPGDYEIIYEIMDPSYNVTRITKVYKIISKEHPEIKQEKDLVITVNTSFNHHNYFKYTDVYDTNLVIIVDDSNVNYEILGEYPLFITAINNSELSTLFKTKVTIIDDVKPILIVDTNKVIEVNEYERKDLKNFVTYVSDNYDLLTKDDIQVFEDVDLSKIGKYEVIYKIVDKSNNEISKKMILEVKDLKKPTIKLKKNLEIDVFDSNIFWNNYFEITDNYDEYDDLTIKFDISNINFKKIGIYTLGLTVTDSSKNKRIEYFDVIIQDMIPPEIVQKNEIIITDFTYKDNDFYKSFFEITDNYDDSTDIILEIKTNIDYFKTGVTTCEFIFKDKSNNQKLIKADVYIIDNEIPIINLYQDEYYYFVGDQIPNLRELIKEYKDNYTIKDKLEIEIKSSIDYEKIGKYQVDFILKDEAYNETIKTMNFYVDKRKNIKIDFTNITMNKNDYWSPLDGIIIGEDVVRYEYYPKVIDTTKVGKNEIKYIGYDIRGNYTEIIQIIEIVDENNKNKINIYIQVIITITGLIMIIYIYVQSRKKTINFDKI